MRLIYSIIAVGLISVLLFSCTLKSMKDQEESNNAPALLDTSDSLADERGYIVAVGDIAPDFEMELPDGTSVTLSSLKGKVVMLQFTASWCGVCRKEMPYIEKDIWAKHLNNIDFALYGIDREEPVDKVKKLIDKTGATYPIGLDPDAEIFSLFAKKESGITRNIIIGKDGKIVMLTRLFELDEFNEMVQIIDSLLNV